MRDAASAADWQADCVGAMLRNNPKALLAFSAFKQSTQFDLPFKMTKHEDGYEACISISLEHGEELCGIGTSKTKKRAELLAAEDACIKLNKLGLLNIVKKNLGWRANPRLALINSALFNDSDGKANQRALPFTYTECGPGHAKVFTAELILPIDGDEEYVASGHGTSKSVAERICCMNACEKFFEDGLMNTSSSINENMVAHIQQQNELPPVLEVNVDVDTIERVLLQLQDDIKVEAAAILAEHAVHSPYETLKKFECENKQMKAEASAREFDRRFQETMEIRQSLPTWPHKQNILDSIKNNQVVVLTGDTGCGKSTQIPQFVLEDAETEGFGAEINIIVTQPRRIAAISLSERIAWERGEELGRSVGYTIRLDSVMPRSYGRILFCTAGVLLWRMQKSDGLAGVSHVFIDEAHERDVATDMLIAVVRDMLKINSAMRLIIMSATVDASLFTSYFDGCPHISIPGRMHSVKVYFLEELQALMGQSVCKENESDDGEVDCELVASTISWVSEHFAESGGAILCFLPGWASIMTLKDKLSPNSSLKIVPLHSQLSSSEQRLAFMHAPIGQRKVVLATNIAETSVTIDDVVYVIDCGKMKEKQYRPRRNMATLNMQWISKACALQRQGRAGRVQPGFCFRLYTRQTYSNMMEHRKPEVQRLPLDELCLQIKAIVMPNAAPSIKNASGIFDISSFMLKTLEPPAPHAISAGVDMLKQLGAIDGSENLTSLGRLLAKFAVDPRYGKLLVYGTLLGCVEEVLTIAAASCFKDPFVAPLDRVEEVSETKRRFSSGSAFGSDQLGMVRVFQQFYAARLAGGEVEADSFCERNLLSPVIMRLIQGMRAQFGEVLEAHFPSKSIGSVSRDGALQIARCLMACGLSPNIARTEICKEKKGKKRISHRWRLGFCVQCGRVLMHPASVVEEKVLDPSRHYYLVYEERVRSKQAFVRGCSLVPALALVLFSGNVRVISKEGDEDDNDDDKKMRIVVECWLSMIVGKRVGNLIMEVRKKLNAAMERWIGACVGPTSDADVGLAELVQRLCYSASTNFL